MVLGSRLALTTGRFQSHASQVPAAVRLHLRDHVAGVECRRKRLHGGRDAGIPRINPSLNNLPVCGRVFHGHLNQSLTPFPMPLAVFIERVKNLPKQMIIFPKC